MRDSLPYNQWPEDTYERQYEAERAFGRALIKNLQGQLHINRNSYAALVPSLSAAEVETLALKAAFDGIYAVMMLLDGVANSPIDSQHGIEWVLQARILEYGAQKKTVAVPMETGGNVTLHSFLPAGTKRVETVELVPNGDGLCYAFHDWKEGYDDYDQSRD